MAPDPIRERRVMPAPADAVPVRRRHRVGTLPASAPAFTTDPTARTVVPHIRSFLMNHPRKRAPAPAARSPRSDTSAPTTEPGIGRWLAASVTWFGPFTAIAASMTVFAMVIGGPAITNAADQILSVGDWNRPETWASMLIKIGVSGLTFLPVAVSGYLAYGLAGRPALIPGILGGMAALGILGGILAGLAAGLIAGAATAALGRIPVPAKLRAPVSTGAVPLLATLVTVIPLIALGSDQLTSLTSWLHQKLVWLEFNHLLVAGALLGVMACCDLGGAIGKTALAFGAVGVSGPDATRFNPTDMTMMAAVLAASMVPPLGMTLATLLRRRLFTDAERGYGRVAWIFGAVCLSEGAVPFAVADPLRVIPAGLAGGAVTGTLVMAFGTTVSVPGGGVLAADKIGAPALFAAAVLAGAIVTAAVALALKHLRRTPASTGGLTATVSSGRKTLATV
jgi:fructose-specific phosphotransferase system IIC component